MEIQKQKCNTHNMNVKQFATLGDYTLIEKLGSGGNAKVYLGYNNKDKKQYAIKIITNQNIIKNAVDISNEVKMMQKLQEHPNILKLYEVNVNWDIYTCKCGKKKQVMYIIIELAGGGELYEYIAYSKSFSEVISRTYFQQIINALKHCFERGVTHRDLKPANLLFDDQFVLKIADFGFATLLEGKQKNEYLRTFKGTKRYMAPQIHLGQPYKGAEVDLFATAIILFNMYAGCSPFRKATINDLYYTLIQNDKAEIFWENHANHKENGYYNNEFMDLITRMLQFDPSNRLTIDQIENHAWYKGPTMSQEDLIKEFSERKKIVDIEIEKEKVKKKKEKEQKQGQLMFTGVNSFRSLSEVQTNEFQGLEDKYGTLKLKRQVRINEDTKHKVEAVYLAQDVEYLWHFLVKTCDQEFTQVILNDNKYKLAVSQIDEEQTTKFDVNIIYLKNEDLNCVQFLRTSGDTLEFYKITKIIKDKLQTLKQKKL